MSEEGVCRHAAELPERGQAKTGLVPETTLEQMVREMVHEDHRDAEKDELCKREGDRVFDYYE